MSIKSSQGAVGLRGPVRVEAGRGLAVRWSVARAALREDLRGPGEGPATLEVSVVGGPGAWSVAATVRAGGAERDVSALLGPAPGEARGWSRDGDLEHLDLPGVLCATWRRGPGGIEVLYAQSALPGALGLGGGRYELEGGSLTG